MNCKYKRGQHVKLLGSCRKCSILYTATANNKIFIIEQLWDFSKFTTAELKCNECGLYFTDSLQTKNLDIHYFTNAFVIIEI